jgi:hypothetical protein
MMLIYRDDAFGMDGLREILGTLAHELDQCMLLTRWHDGQRTNYVITTDDTSVAGDLAFEPIVLASPDGACLPVRVNELDRQSVDGGSC